MNYMKICNKERDNNTSNESYYHYLIAIIKFEFSMFKADHTPLYL